MDVDKSAASFHEEAADSEELCEEALRCQDCSVSFHMCPNVPKYPAEQAKVGEWALGYVAGSCPVPLTIALLVTPPSARVARRPEPVNIMVRL